MKNLFDYATKELSQDAFLLWIFENCNDESIGHIGKELVAAMVNLSRKEQIEINDISDVEAYSQIEKMDIVVDFKIQGIPCILIVEDKTVSSEHNNQLTRYKNIVLKKWNVKDKTNRESFFVFYKTHRMNEDERIRIKNSGWSEFEFDQIKKFWEPYQCCDNLIISQYSQHVVKCWNDCKNVSRPIDNNIDQWIGYFENTIKPSITLPCDIWINSTHYGYAYFCVRPLGMGDEPFPYLEIRSRDCLNDNFEAKILMYDVDQKYLTKIRDIIRTNEIDGIYKGDYGEKKNKQVAHTYRNGFFKVKNDKDFICLTNTVIKEYLKIVHDL